MKNGSEVQLGALRGFVLPPHFLSEAENLSKANIVRIALTFGLTVATLAASIGKDSFSDRSNVHIYFLSHPYWHIHWTSIGPIISGLVCPSMTH